VLGGIAMTALKQHLLRMLMLTLFGVCAFLLPAQNIDIQSDDDKPLEEKLVYNHQNTYNVAIHSRGFGAGFKIGRIKSIDLTRNWEAEVVSLHSLKEIKTLNITTYNMRPFVYGKLNYAYVARFGYGEERRIFGKPYWGGIETRWTYEFGASLALLKPYYYYVTVYKQLDDGNYWETYDEQTFDHKNEWVDVLGRSSFTKGIAETKLSPGFHASLGLSFDFAKSRTRVQALNVDVKAECFPMGISLMDSERDRWLFITFMLSYNWGSRFNNY
jgi:hypothetical protein